MPSVTSELREAFEDLLDLAGHEADDLRRERDALRLVNDELRRQLDALLDRWSARVTTTHGTALSLVCRSCQTPYTVVPKPRPTCPTCRRTSLNTRPRLLARA